MFVQVQTSPENKIWNRYYTKREKAKSHAGHTVDESGQPLIQHVHDEYLVGAFAVPTLAALVRLGKTPHLDRIPSPRQIGLDSHSRSSLSTGGNFISIAFTCSRRMQAMRGVFITHGS